MKIDYYLAKRHYNNGIYCGDTGMVKEFDDKVFAAVIDALGHGKNAHELAEICTNFLAENYRQKLIEMMEKLHQYIRGSRGVVASLCLVDMKKSTFSHVSVGDTTVRKLNNDRSRGYSMPGIIGYQMRSLQEKTMKLDDSDIIILHTDGIPSHFNQRAEGILQGDARAIACNIIAQFSKKHDDALCIILRCMK
ncbi:SpoIIE family protein phosphatase [Desulfobacterales bacterium HSG16]|nr:SpoIIE family protein phosphatase [Desulfobacterales bacterium HSG16]